MQVSHGGSYTHYWISPMVLMLVQKPHSVTHNSSHLSSVLLVTDVRLHKNMLTHTRKSSKHRHTQFHCFTASVDAACWINSGPHVCLVVSSVVAWSPAAKIQCESKMLKGDLDIFKIANSWFCANTCRPDSKKESHFERHASLNKV